MNYITKYYSKCWRILHARAPVCLHCVATSHYITHPLMTTTCLVSTPADAVNADSSL